MGADEPKRRGRPLMPVEKRKNSNLTFRTRNNLRARLEDAARASGRSVSEEIEARLDRSLLADEIRLAIREELGKQ